MFVHLENIPKLKCSKCGQTNYWPIRYWQGSEEITQCKHCDYKKVTATITTTGTGRTISYQGKKETIQSF